MEKITRAMKGDRGGMRSFLSSRGLKRAKNKQGHWDGNMPGSHGTFRTKKT